MNNNYGYPPPYVMAGGFDLDAFIKFQEYMKTSNPTFNKPVKSKSEIKDFLRLWNAFKEADEKKKKEDELKKKEEDAKKKDKEGVKPPTFTLIQTIMITATFGLPVGALWLTVMSQSFHIIKDMIFK